MEQLTTLKTKVMSNTDGEDIQRIEGFNPGDKAYILTEEQYIKFEKQNDVIADLKFKLKNDAIFQEYSDLEKELASLREQLKQRDKELERLNNDLLDALDLKNGNGPTALSMLSEKLKQKEDENREFRKEIEFLLDGDLEHDFPNAAKRLKTLIKKANNLSA